MSPKKRINKQNPVGNFSERVLQRIVGGVLTRNEDGDICLESENATVEVKSCCLESSYGFRISTEQLRHYERIGNGFPYDHMWYGLVAYKNPRLRDGQTGKKVTTLSRCDTVASIEKHVANSLSWCLLVDLSIIRRLSEVLPHSNKSVMGHPGMETVNLHAKKTVYPFANGGLAQSLVDLGLDPESFGVLTGRIKTTVEIGLYDKYPILIPEVRVVVLKEALSFVRRALRRQGFRLREYKIESQLDDTFK